MAQDIIDRLTADHREVEQLLGQLEETAPEDREDLFRAVVSRLARHEAGEEAIVHPVTNQQAGQGEKISASVREEEQQAEELMADMENTDPTSDEFLEQFRRLRKDVLTHAEHEEDTEFPRLRDALEEEQLVEMGQAFERLKQAAPTHPHPRTPNDAVSQILLGPVAGIFDRARDAARNATA